jgi:exodeoxyribonuclease VII large subunit
VDRALNNSIATRIRLQTNHLAQVSRRLRHPGTRLTDLHQRLDDLELRLRRTFRLFISGFRIEDSQARLVRAMKRGLERNDARIHLAGSRLTSPAAQVRAARVQLDHTMGRLKSVLYNELRYKAQNLVAIEQNLTAYSPAAVLDRGYAIIMKQGKVLQDARQVSPGEEIIARLKHGEITANVTGTDSSAGVGGAGVEARVSEVKDKED